jgi:two-component system, cell cycle response regulator
MVQTVVPIAQQSWEAAHGREIDDTGGTTMGKLKNIRILLAGDHDGRAAQALRALFCEPEHELELTAVSTIATLLPTLGVVNPEIIVLDIAIVRDNAREAVRRLHRATPSIPLVVLADEAKKDAAKDTLLEGAMDYILREYMDTATLSRIFRGALERNTLEGLADLLRDKSTGFYSRDGLMTIGCSTMDRMRRNSGTLALFCVRIQNLNEMRSEMGSGAADTVLQALTSTLGDCFRRSDILARMGDAQFAAVAVDATEAGAGILRQRLERRLALLLEMQRAGGMLRFSVNGGMWNYRETTTFPELLDTIEAGLRAPADNVLVSA